MTSTSERPVPHFFAQLTATLSASNQRLFFAVLVISVAPIWIGTYPPMIDMPQHAAQVAALHEMWAGNETYTRLFEINWFTPYLLGYMLLVALSKVLSITVATQLVVSVSVIALPILTGRLLRAAGADERWKWLAIPCIFSFSCYWGFLSYLVAAPLALPFLIQTIRFVDQPTVKRGLTIAAFSIALFFAHVVVLGFASLVALGYVFGRSFRDVKTLVLRALPYTAPIPLIVIWLASAYRAVPTASTEPTIYGSFVERVAQLLLQPAGHDGFTLITLLVTATIVLLPPLAGSTFSRRPERWLPFALGLLVFVAAPRYVITTAYFFQRLGIFLVPLWLLAWDPPTRPGRRLDWVPAVIVLLWSFTNIGRFAGFARESETFRDVLAAMQPGRTVAAMVEDKSSQFFAWPVYLHFPAWYAATGRGIVDFNFADFYSSMVRYRKDAGPRITDALSWYPTAFEWDVYGGERYDYFVVKSRVDISNQIFKEKRGSVELVTHSGWWWLYRNLERDPAQH
jgi:hypothetical protein